MDTWSQISAFTEGVCSQMGFKILPVRNFIGGVLHHKGTVDILILHEGNVKANFTIPHLP